ACALRRDFVETGNAETSSRHSFGSFGDQGEGARTMLFFDARDAGPRIDLRVLLRFGETLREALPLCRIIYDLVANIVNSYAFDPRGRALEIMRFFAIVLQECRGVFHDFVGRTHFGEQIGHPDLHATVAADVDLPARFHRDHADVFDRGFGTVPRASGHGHLDLVRRPGAPRAALH